VELENSEIVRILNFKFNGCLFQDFGVRMCFFAPSCVSIYKLMESRTVGQTYTNKKHFLLFRWKLFWEESILVLEVRSFLKSK
jgi:hypothetical protein